MISFSNWVTQRESSPFTRARNDAALGLKPWSAMGGNINAHSTARPWQLERYKKAISKKKKIAAAKKVIPKNKDVDKWLQEVDALKDDLVKLRAIFDKLKKKPQEPKKPEKPEKEDKEEKSTDDEEKDGKEEEDSVE